jgi:uncharacterized protein YbjQ (UPF0145 family)
MILCTSDHVAGFVEVECLGLVRGNTVRSRHIGRDVMAEIRNLVGGEVNEYTKMLAEAREEALDRMSAEAEKLGADAIVTVRFGTAEVMQHAAEVIAYGTAVRLRRHEAGSSGDAGWRGR